MATSGISQLVKILTPNFGGGGGGGGSDGDGNGGNEIFMDINYFTRFFFQKTPKFILTLCTLVLLMNIVGYTIVCSDLPAVKVLNTDYIRTYCLYNTVATKSSHRSIALLEGLRRRGGGGASSSSSAAATYPLNYYIWIPVYLSLQSLSIYIVHNVWQYYSSATVFTSLVAPFNNGGTSFDSIIASHEDVQRIATRIVRYYRAYLLHENNCSFVCGYILFQLSIVTLIVCNCQFITYYLEIDYHRYALFNWQYIAHQVFPLLASCTLHTYGPSGSTQRHDVICILPLNYFYRYLYLLLWYWMCVIGTLCVTGNVVNLCFVLFPCLRQYYLRYYLYCRSDRRRRRHRRRGRWLETMSFREYLLLIILLMNINQMFRSDILAAAAVTDDDDDDDVCDDDDVKDGKDTWRRIRQRVGDGSIV